MSTCNWKLYATYEIEALEQKVYLDQKGVVPKWCYGIKSRDLKLGESIRKGQKYLDYFLDKYI